MALVLLVEDDEELRTTIAAALGEAGFAVAEADSGETGLSLIRDLQPDVIVCDIGLPGLSGGEVLTKLRQDRPESGRIPFLFLTALSEPHHVVAGRKLGADDYLTKPVDIDLLIAAVEQRLDQARRWDDSFADRHLHEREALLASIAVRSRLSFLSAAEVLNHLSDGVILLNAAGQPIFVNRVGQRILLEDDGLSIGQAAIAATRAKDRARLTAAIAAVTSGTEPARHLSISRPSDRADYLLRICRLEAHEDPGHDSGARAAVFVTDPDAPRRPSEPALTEMFGISPAEAAIAADIAVGQTVEEIASRRRISRNTVHSHLRALFNKTGTTRQTELVARLLAPTPTDSTPAGA